MIETIKVSLLTMMLTAWSALAMAQAPTGGTAAPGDAGAAGDGETSTWLWVVLAVVVIAALLYYFLGRGRRTTRI
ncbi:hypothetical protein [Microvirga pakistanensis]|uniref:hypothetical protein n=1 Tax=Microvirga pakistanensis TaxID=1682650 RepID=UPI00106944F5|nr:hypothetical protein [Microvirga pakistanensis]